MWERITVALAELGPAALAVSEEQRGEEAVEPTSEEDLVQYEGMLISVAAAQRRRCARFCFESPWLPSQAHEGR